MLTIRPYRQENNLFRFFDEMERSFFGNQPLSTGANQLRTDITDDGDCYTLHADLPGFRKEDISIDLEDNRLTISAETKSETEDKGDNFVRRERRYGSFSRSFDVSDIRTADITAAYENGVLRLTLPKKEQAAVETAKKIAIE